MHKIHIPYQFSEFTVLNLNMHRIMLKFPVFIWSLLLAAGYNYMVPINYDLTNMHLLCDLKIDQVSVISRSRENKQIDLYWIINYPRDKNGHTDKVNPSDRSVTWNVLLFQ